MDSVKDVTTNQSDSAGYELLDGNLKGVGNTRIQATIGLQKSQSNSSSYAEVNQGSTIQANNLALIATGTGTDNDININGSNLNVTNNALFQADNDFNVNGVAQNSNTHSDNSSSSAAICGYASFGGQGPSSGITANASKGKGYANSDSVTYANSQVNVGGTSTLDIGNDLNIKGGVINTGKAQGIIGGNVYIESLQDTATYDSNQKNMGFTADIALEGAGSSLSLNGGKTNINADYKAVGEQSGIFTGDGGFDLEVGGKTTLIGGAITTTDAALAAGLNKYVSKGGITTQDIENTSSYEGDAISVGLSVGNTTGKPQATMNGLGYGTDGDSDSSTTRAGIAGNSGITTDNQAEYAGALDNVFDETKVNEELGAQKIITKEFGKEAPKAVGDFANNRIKAIRADTTFSDAEKVAAIEKWDEGGIYRVAAHTALGALGTGSVEGALTTGGVAAAAPTLNDIQVKVAKALIDTGMSEDVAKGAASGVISLTLLGAGSAAGLDTSSTVTAINVDANNRQLHPSEIQFILDKDRVKRFADKYGLTEEEAKQLLSLNAAAMYDYNWMMAVDEIGAANPAVRVFLKQEAKNAGYSQLFNSEYITKEELSNPFINLKTTFDAYSEGDKHVEDYINNVAIPVDDYLAQQLYKQGQKAGYASAGEGANIATDLGTIFEGLKQAPSYIYESATNDEVGPIDSAKMKMYYDRLLRLQGNYYDAGFTSEKEFAEAQRLYWAGEMLGAAGGAAIGQAGRLAGKVGDGIVKLHTPSNAINVPNNNQTGAVGNLSNIDKIGDYVLPTGRQSLDPTRTSFSQATVSYQKTGKPYNYDTIVADMKAKNGWIGDPVDVVNMPDRAPTSMDNTRVLAAREAGVKVEANVHNHSDPLTPSEAQRFKYNGATPTNWGEAIKLRIKKQSQEGFAPKDWSERFSNGSIYDPEVTK